MSDQEAQEQVIDLGDDQHQHHQEGSGDEEIKQTQQEPKQVKADAQDDVEELDDDDDANNLQPELNFDQSSDATGQEESVISRKQSYANEEVALQHIQQQIGRTRGEILPEMQQFSKLASQKEQELFKLAAKEREVSEVVKQFSVTDPTLVDKVIKYRVTGVDRDGGFEVSRRFNHFYALGKMLKENWPGFYVPAIPDKKTTGNQDPKFLEERRALLDRFLKEIARYDFLRNSELFYQFARNDDVEKALAQMPKARPGAMLDRFRENFPQVDETLSAEEQHRCVDTTKEYSRHIQNAIVVLRALKKHFKSLKEKQEKVIQHQGQIVNKLYKFEESAMGFLYENDAQKQLSNWTPEQVAERVQPISQRELNPFLGTYVWLKGEILDMQGMKEAIAGREFLVQAQKNLEAKKRSNQAEVEKRQAGKTTFKSMLKSKSAKENELITLQASIDAASQDLIDYSKVIQFVTIYLGQTAVEHFKKDKVFQYKRVITQFAVQEVQNSNEIVKLNAALLKLTNDE